ncbi:hypothetical protein EAI88_11070 [Eubacterium ramulus]|nr:hypothetical protein EAI88_11070 [Eubacterium ramulus]
MFRALHSYNSSRYSHIGMLTLHFYDHIGMGQKPETTPVQAHHGFRLLTLASYFLYIIVDSCHYHKY